LIVDQHLGNWISPLGYNNSVVGFSYDIVGGRRCLSFGVGMGNWPVGNGASELNGGGQLQVATALKSLEPNVATDPSPSVVYPYQNPVYGTFLRTYGVWANPGGSPNGPYTWDTQGNPYTFDAPHTSGSVTYYYEFSADNSGYFYVDGTEISISGDLTGSTTGSISLTPGRHTIAWLIDNIDGPGALGLRIYSSNGTDIWSTLTPIGSVPYWLDYGRIYLDGSNRAYYSKDSYVRNLGLSGNFGVGSSNSSMFTVTDDGYGNLNIALSTLRQYTGDGGSNTTLGTLTESFYYYSANTDHPRFNNLESPINDSQTHYFTGFTNPGEVTTSIVPFPVPPPPPPPPPPPDENRGGRGGGGGEGPGNYGPLTDSEGGRILGRCGAWNSPPVSGDANYSHEGTPGTLSGGDSPGGDCHVPWAKITMADGSFKEIQYLNEGDEIQGFGGINVVLAVLPRILDSRLVSFNEIDYFVSENHPILTDKGWGCFNPELFKLMFPEEYANVVQDNEGNELVTIINGSMVCQYINEKFSYIPVNNIKYEARDNFIVYRIKVTNDKTFIAENIVSHNKD
jgi:hypothetical protein